MPLNNLVLASKVFVLAIPIIIIVVGLWWFYMEL